MSQAEHCPEVLTLAGVYSEHASFVWSALQRFGVAEEAAEDLLHEVFLIVRRRLPDFDASRSLRGWLHGICRGVAANHRRGRVRQHRREEALAWTPTVHVQTPEEALAQREAAAKVDEFLQSLEASRREVFVLMDIEGMTGPEVAEVLALPLVQVHTRLRSARNSFQAFLRQESR